MIKNLQSLGIAILICAAIVGGVWVVQTLLGHTGR